MTRDFWRGLILGLVILPVIFPVPAAAFDAGMPPISESKAYRQFLERPFSDLSVLIYLIDRFRETPIEIVYDRHYFPAALAAGVAKWFLAVQYRKETPSQWVRKWCSDSVPGGEPIWVKDGRGAFARSHDVLMNELHNLQEVCAQDPKFASSSTPCLIR